MQWKKSLLSYLILYYEDVYCLSVHVRKLIAQRGLEGSRRGEREEGEGGKRGKRWKGTRGARGAREGREGEGGKRGGKSKREFSTKFYWKNTPDILVSGTTKKGHCVSYHLCHYSSRLRCTGQLPRLWRGYWPRMLMDIVTFDLAFNDHLYDHYQPGLPKVIFVKIQHSLKILYDTEYFLCIGKYIQLSKFFTTLVISWFSLIAENPSGRMCN